MEIFFGVDLPNNVMSALDKCSDDALDDLKLWGKTRHEILNHVNDSCEDMLIYLAHQNGISVLLMDKTPYTIHMNILAPVGTNTNKVINFLKSFLDEMKEKTDIHKFEVFSTCPDMHRILLKVGFSIEGVLVDSRRLPTGEFIDEVCYGYLVDV